MKIRSTVAALGATLALGFASASHAVSISQQHTFYLDNQSSYDVGTESVSDGAVAENHFYQLIVNNMYDAYTKFRTYSTDPLGLPATYTIFADLDPSTTDYTVGGQVTTWTQQDVPLVNSVPFYQYLLTAGSQYVLRIDTSVGQNSIGTAISSVPLPGAIWLFGSALLAFLGISSRRKV